MSGGYVTGATPMIRAILLALLTALLACSAPSEAPRVAEVLRLTVRFQAGMQADHRVRAREAIATAWMGTGAVVLVEGAPWESVPTPTAGPCTPEVHVGWLDPSSPDAPEWEERAGYFARSAAAEARWKFGPDDRFDVDLLTCSRDERRPDLDNVAKACLDALNGIIYQDDRHVEALAIRSGGAVHDPYVLITVRRFVPKGAP